MPDPVLTIGMATHKEHDMLWATLTGLSANHPRVEYLVVDNSPERDPRSENITRAVGGRYFHRPDLVGTSKPRDAVFRLARTPWAMCIDAHVILENGAVQAALDYAAGNPESKDILSGPLVMDDGKGISTYWNQAAPPALWGTWQADPRGHDRNSSPFEIHAMGLGLFMMRTAAWPGFHPLFRGFGAEEGYIHELVRRNGGEALCHPSLRWRHKFRDTSGWHNNPPPPYPLNADDMVWNQLVAHRHLGLAADEQIRSHHGKHMTPDSWKAMIARADKAQVFGGARPDVKRQRILALWYSDNTAPPALLGRSGGSVVTAQQQTLRHDVTVSAVSWAPIPGEPFGGDNTELMGERVMWTPFEGSKNRSHRTIIAQIKQAASKAGDRWWDYKHDDNLSNPGGWTVGSWDAVCFLEHDVLYPPGYFDRMGDALAQFPDAPVVSHLDYIGLNATGWQAVKERHEPLHQLCLRWDTFLANLDRAEKEAVGGAQVILEPDHGGERKNWVRIKPTDATGKTGTPSVHVNHTAGRFTGHGDVCYEPRGFALWQAHWGEAKKWWPGQMEVLANVDAGQFKGNAKPGGCGACEAAKHNTLADWYKVAASIPSDFHEHVPTLRDLAARCGSATELSAWGKPADAALATGLGDKGRFTSVCHAPKPQWQPLIKWMGPRFKSVAADPAELSEIEETDLLFIDTGHTAAALAPLLEKHHGRVAKYLVVHCTETYGETGDRPDSVGVMGALRGFCLKHPEWVVKRRDRNNHGLMVLSRCPEDVKNKPSLWRQAMNYTAAMAKHVAGGRQTVSLKVLEGRQAECAVCPERALDACAACGCPLEAKLPLATEKCPKGRWDAAT